MILAKICLLGEVAVGKTSLIRRFIDRSFSENYLCTVGVNISRKLVRVPVSNEGGTQEIQLIFWDLEGGSPIDAIIPAYLKGAAGAVVVGDVTRTPTLNAIADHLDRYFEVNPEGFAVIALNKSDLVDEQAAMMSKNWVHRERALQTFHTSAKTGAAVDEIFAFVGSHLIRGTSGSEHESVG